MLFKADLILKDFSRKPFKFKYFSSLANPENMELDLYHTVMKNKDTVNPLYNDAVCSKLSLTLK